MKRETPQRPIVSRMFCIGKPDPQRPGMIRLDSGMRLPVGIHLWEHGPVMLERRNNVGGQILLTSRFSQCSAGYVDGLRHDPDPALCEGRLDPILRGHADDRQGILSWSRNDDRVNWCCGYGHQRFILHRQGDLQPRMAVLARNP